VRVLYRGSELLANFSHEQYLLDLLSTPVVSRRATAEILGSALKGVIGEM